MILINRPQQLVVMMPTDEVEHHYEFQKPESYSSCLSMIPEFSHDDNVLGDECSCDVLG